MSELDIQYQPFLRWVGGKSWLLKSHPFLFNKVVFRKYHEPFLGGGSVFFALAPERAFLSDLNEELILTYAALRDNPNDVIDVLKDLKVDETSYYKIRASKPEFSHTRAARFIYLNRTSFNGIYRVNREGNYNVPYGKNDNYKFDCDRILLASKALQGAELSAGSFTDMIKNVGEGDLVFLDPPYTVSHNKNGFIEYNQVLFSIENQRDLKKYIDAVDQKGAFYILTNAAHQTIKEIFHDNNHKLTCRRKSMLGGKNARRGDTDEYIFTNLPLGEGELYGH